MLFILLMVIMGIVGYLITPDQTPYANTMHLQLSSKKPGRSFEFLIISRNPKVAQVNVFEKMLYGQEANFKSIPITSHRTVGNIVYAREYIGDDEQAEETAFPLVSGKNVYKQTFWLGTDMYGRDILSRLILGIRVSLSVGLMAVLISLFIGLSFGAISGYFGGKIDAGISWFMNVIWSLPSLAVGYCHLFCLG